MGRLQAALRSAGRAGSVVSVGWLVIELARSTWFALGEWGPAGLIDAVVVYRFGLLMVMVPAVRFGLAQVKRSVSAVAVRNTMVAGALLIVLSFARFGGRVAWPGLALVMAVAGVALAMSVERRYRGRALVVGAAVTSIVGSWIGIALIGWLVHGYALVPYPGPLPAAPADPAEARAAEARYLLDEIARMHTDPFATLSEADFREWADGVEIKAASGPAPMVLELMRIVAALADPNTKVSFGAIPAGQAEARFEWFGEELFLTGVGPDDRDVLGHRVLAIDGTPVAEVHQELAQYVPGRNPGWAKRGSADLMTKIHLMGELGFAGADSLTLTLVDDQGTRAKVEIGYGGGRLYVDSGSQAGYRRVDVGPARWDLLAGDTVAYFRYQRSSEPFEFRSIANEFWAAVDRAEPDRFVVDLRGNFGGSSLAFDRWFFGELRDRQQSSGLPVFVLVDAATFSTAVDHAHRMREELGATLVGEPTGSGPGGSGAIRTIRLRQSSIAIEIPTRAGSGGPVALTPDALVITSGFDAMAGKDVVLETALAPLD